MDAFFFPSDKNIKKMVDYIMIAKNTIDIAVFSFTNNQLANALITKKKEGIKIRLIVDDEQAEVKGADAQKLADAGIPVRNDGKKRVYMHHKFMIVDSEFLVTGSFNWSVRAVRFN